MEVDRRRILDQSLSSEGIPSSQDLLMKSGRDIKRISQDTPPDSYVEIFTDTSWMVLTGQFDPSLNMAYFGFGNTEEQIALFTQLLRKQGVPGIAYTMKNQSAIFEQNGFDKLEDSPLMIFSPDNSLPVPDVGVRIEKVDPGDENVSHEAIKIQSEALFINEEGIKATLGKKTLEDRGVCLFVARDVDRNVVSTVMTIREGNIVGIWNMATANDEQGKGYGNSLLRQVINTCMLEGEGQQVFHLLSSKIGEKLYEKIGFQKIEDTTMLLKEFNDDV